VIGPSPDSYPIFRVTQRTPGGVAYLTMARRFAPGEQAENWDRNVHLRVGVGDDSLLLELTPEQIQEMFRAYLQIQRAYEEYP
jgi:hypothetical protein